MIKYFRFQEFTAEDLITPEIAQRIYVYHMLPLDAIREELGSAIGISGNSGYRSYERERLEGRSGDSEHTFTRRGAVDVMSVDMGGLGRLLEESCYATVCFYPNKGFYHCDYKQRKGGRLFTCEDGKVWHTVETR